MQAVMPRTTLFTLALAAAGLLGGICAARADDTSTGTGTSSYNPND